MGACQNEESNNNFIPAFFGIWIKFDQPEHQRAYQYGTDYVDCTEQNREKYPMKKHAIILYNNQND